MIRLLHLSDLHFGPHSRLAGQDHAQAGKSFHRALLDAEPSLRTDQGIDVVVVSGDLAEVGKPKEMALAHEFLQALAGELGLEPQRFVFCPGNHDVSRAASHKVELDQAIEDFDDAELRRRIDAVKLKFYDDFVRRFYGEPPEAVAQPLGFGAFVYAYPRLRLSVAALNSCEKESHRAGDHVGHVSADQAQALMDFWQAGEVTRSLKIVVVHHNPTMTVMSNVASWRDWLKSQQLTDDQVAAWEGDILGFEGKEWLRRIVEDCEVQLVLHGHHHTKDEHVWSWKGKGYAHVLSAGSLSLMDHKLPGTEPASFRLIRLDPATETLRARALVWVDWARTAGDVQRGAFKPDPDGDYEKTLDLPADFPRRAAPDEAVEQSVDRADLMAFVRIFRIAFRGAYSRWDLANVGVTQVGGATHPIDVRIDDMYVPLRLGTNYDLGKFDQGEVITPEALLRRTKPLAIRGSAGSGKTTWMRWTFRRLLDFEHALPLMLVLRDLAMYWSDALAGNERSLEAFLDAWAAEQIGSGWEKGYVKQIFEAQNGPTPILLVDGWDELGPLGEKVRERLVGLMHLYPRLKVVVSSRPYGEGRPADVEGFETLELQPLSGTLGTAGRPSPAGREGARGEIESLARNFFLRCYRDEEGSKVSSTAAFMDALARSVDAQTLARTPLLLTMMLLISRSRPLPDKRHDLYEACIDSLLTARTERKEKTGAQLLLRQWRPDDADERKRAAAGLAYGLQDSEDREGGRRAIAASWQEAMDALPARWSERQRKGFLAWLVGPAGLLVDRSDRTLTFVHLSFQEYLTAWHLDATVEGAEPRIAVFRRLLDVAYWRETLLLWAARIHKKNPERLDEVIAALGDSKPGLCLAGHMFADGVGSEAAFETWAERFFAAFDHFLDIGSLRVAKTWAFCRQEERKPYLVDAVSRRAASLSWLGHLRSQVWCEWALIPVSVPQPRQPVPRALLAPFSGQQATGPQATGQQGKALQAIESSPEIVAAGRLLCSGAAFWPPDDAIGFLNVWPGHRRLAGLRLQSLVAAGAPAEVIPSLCDNLLTLPSVENEDWVLDAVRDLARRLPSYFGRDFPPRVARDLARDFSRDFTLYLSTYFDREVVGSLVRYLDFYFVRYFARYFGCDFATDFTKDLGRFFSRYFATDLGGELSGYFADKWGLDLDQHSWLFNFSDIEWKSPGRVVGRSVLAANRSQTAPPVVQLLASGCRLTNAPEADAAELARALDDHGPSLEPVWPALARHLARRSDAADRALLEGLARDPDRVEDGPLRWGLRFIVRGDVMLPDGSFVALDALCDEAGLPHLPYLEDPPETLAIDWDVE